jgi:hypothetical protein
MDLTPEMKTELDELKKDFNIVHEYDDIDYLASRRVEITKVWIPKLLKMILIINCFTILFISLSLITISLKPRPEYYGSTPNGKVFKLKNVKVQETKSGVITYD